MRLRIERPNIFTVQRADADRAYRQLPERDRWAMYDFAKQQREDMQAAGFQLTETYDQFVRRVTAELEI